MNFSALYSAFEIFPSRKGASTHIVHMVKALAKTCPPVLVCTLESNEPWNNEPNIHCIRFNQEEMHYLDRGRKYSIWLADLINRNHSFEIAQFRDIWSGIPIINSRKVWFTVFEVNGLPSVELPYRYPGIGHETLHKLKALEMHCLTEADMIICPSHAIKNYLVSQHLHEGKIQVITNGAMIPEPLKKDHSLPESYITYFGAMQNWQGIDILLKAFNYLKDYRDLHLVLCCSQRDKLSGPYFKLIDQCGLNRRVIWKYMLDEDSLNSVIQHSLMTVAPLKETSRNILQGCSPLKIFESMANKKATIASDIPVVREIITDGFDGKLVRPDRPSDLSRAIRMLIDFPGLAEKLGENAKRTIGKKYLWRDIEMKLSGLYQLNLIRDKRMRCHLL